MSNGGEVLTMKKVEREKDKISWGWEEEGEFDNGACMFYFSRTHKKRGVGWVAARGRNKRKERLEKLGFCLLGYIFPISSVLLSSYILNLYNFQFDS